MKKSLIFTLLASLSLLTSPTWAADTHQHEHDQKASSTMTEKDKQMQMSKMQENMLRMHEQLHKIMDAKNPQDRERLMQEHSRMMQESMSMMGGMSGGGKMGGGGKMDGGMKAKY